MFCGDVMVRQEKGSRFHGGIQPVNPDNGGHDRHPSPPRAASPWKVTISSDKPPYILPSTSTLAS